MGHPSLVDSGRDRTGIRCASMSPASYPVAMVNRLANTRGRERLDEDDTPDYSTISHQLARRGRGDALP